VTKFVFLNLPAHGHVNPTLPIIRKLVEGGAEVICLLPETFRAQVEASGASLAPLPESRPRSAAPLGDAALVELLFRMALQAPALVPGLVERLRILKPDCLVYNTLHLHARLAGRHVGLRAAVFRPFHAQRQPRSVAAPFASPEHAALAAAAERALDMLAANLGMPRISLQGLLALVETPTILFLPREFQAGAEEFGPEFLFAGPCLPEPLPERVPAASRRPRIYISLGTLRNDQPEFYATCLRAFATQSCNVVMSVGKTIDIAALGPIPPHIKVAPSVAQLEILAATDVFISHGGLNSTCESLAFGVPLVVIPSIAEQRLTGRRVQELGLGLVLDHATLTEASLRAAAFTAARDPAMRGRLDAMRDIIEASGGATRAAAALAKHAAGA